MDTTERKLFGLVLIGGDAQIVPPVQPGTQNITATVSVTYELK